MKQTSVRLMTTIGLIAALYAALTMCLTPIAFGPFQCRLSEALTILAAFTPTAIPGLILGCAISNLIGIGMGANIAGALDVLLGPLATGLAAWLSWRWRRYTVGDLPLLSTLPPVVINALIIGAELSLVSEYFSWQVLVVQVALVGAGQFIACVFGGLLVAKGLRATGLTRYLDNK